MSSLAITCIFFACIVCGTLLGMALRAVLRAEHFSEGTKQVPRLFPGPLAAQV
jgi:hypothetical protein